jgi:hypothetical protein
LIYHKGSDINLVKYIELDLSYYWRMNNYISENRIVKLTLKVLKKLFNKSNFSNPETFLTESKIGKFYINKF